MKGKKNKHIPFRNSPLTKILRSSFGGNSRTLLILNISPSLNDFEISLSTLRFGRCAKKIENVVKTNIMAGYNKEALQKIVNSYEKKITKYKEEVAAIKANQAKMMEFMQGFGVFSEDFMKKMMEQVGDAKGGMKQLMGMWGGRSVDYERLRRMRADLLDQEGKAIEDNRIYIDVLERQSGIIYRLNEKLFDDKEKDVNQVDHNDARFNLQGLKRGIREGDGQEGGKNNDEDEDENENELYFFMNINGEIKKFEKFVVYDSDGNMVYKEDLFDEEGNLKENLFLYDHFCNEVDINHLFDSNDECKLKSKFYKSKLKLSKNSNSEENSKNKNLIFKDRQNQIFKEISRLIETKWPGEMNAPSMKNEEFLSRVVFEKFKEKLDREEILEKTCKAFFEELRIYLTERNSKRDKLSENIWTAQLALYSSLVEALIKRLSDTRHEMEFYERPKRIKHITKEQLKEYSMRLKRMLGVYSKERMRREIVVELRGDNPNLIVNLGDLDEDMIGLGNVKEELALAEKVKKGLGKLVHDNTNDLVNWCSKKNFIGVLDVVEAEIGKEVDNIYDDNYNIQSFFYNYSSAVIKNSEILEKKVMFLTEQLVKNFVRREEYVEKGRKIKPFKVWKRRLSVRNLKEKYKRPMFKNMDMLAESDVMFLYKNIQNKLENFMKVQKDVNRLGTIGNIDDIKGIITSFDQNISKNKENDDDVKKDEIYSGENSEIKEENEEFDEKEENEEFDEIEENDQNSQEYEDENVKYEEEEKEEYNEESDNNYHEEKPKPKPKKKKKKKKKVKKSKENKQSNLPENSNFNTLNYDRNLDRIYGVKSNSFVNKYTPYMASTQKASEYRSPSSNNINYQQDQVRNRGYQTFSHKIKTQQTAEPDFPEETFDPNGSEYQEESDEYEGESDEDMESINDSDVSDVSNPYNMNMKNIQMLDDESGSEEETSIKRKKREKERELKDSELGAYYSSIAQGN